jgi:hypothetical protein
MKRKITRTFGILAKVMLTGMFIAVRTYVNKTRSQISKLMMLFKILDKQPMGKTRYNIERQYYTTFKSKKE